MLSPHFSREEFDSRDGTPALMDRTLVAALENLRDITGGKPLRIVSGYRSSFDNDRVGGARSSQHLVGRAADIPPGYATLEQAVEAGFTGVGTSGRWATHVDVRRGALASWAY